ncbi:hypothetical protein K488DRAFT_16377, partial [Vararia minispora EC-137]
LRPITITFPRLARADGSARFAFGPISALASLSGPFPAPPAAEHPSGATLDILVRPASNIPGPSARTHAAALRAVLEAALVLARCPRTLVSVVVQALGHSVGAGAGRGRRAGKGREDVLINAAACAALCAASLPLRGVPVALSVACLPAPTASGSGAAILVLDPTDAELAAAGAAGCFAFVVGRGAAVPVWMAWR